MGEFGEEFYNVFERVQRGNVSRPLALRVLDAIVAGVTRTEPSYIYFAPEEYPIQFDALTDNPVVDGVLQPRIGSRRVLVFPERHTLWFARGATLELGPNVALIIRGQIRAEATKIFSLPDVRRFWAQGMRTVGRPNEAQLRFALEDAAFAPESALVRIESRRMEAIRPEWFDARTEGNSIVNNGSANARAMQACLDAACRDRMYGDESLLPLTVVCQGAYGLNDTLRGTADANGRGALFLSGDGDVQTRGVGFGLVRFPRTNVRVVNGAAEDAAAPEEDRSALLRVEPGVSLEIEGASFKVEPVAANFLLRGEEATRRDAPRDVRHAILIEEDEEPGREPPWRFVSLDRSGVVGALDSCVTVRRNRRPPQSSLGSTGPAPFTGPVSSEVLEAFALRDGILVDGGKIALANVTVPARGPVRPGRRYVFRDTAFDTHFSIGVPDRSSLYALRVDLAGDAMVELAGGRVQNERKGFDGFIDYRAGVIVRGASLLARAVSFHGSEGPRPSRADWVAVPDGQDVWLDAEDRGPPPHLTMMHCDSQSWWLLGTARARAAGAVSLLNVGAGDVNLLQIPDASAFRRGDAGESFRFFRPPSLVWPGGDTPLLLEACVFMRYAVRANTASRIANVGTTFYQASPSLATWFPPEAVARPGDWLRGRTIPPEWRLNQVLRPTELPWLTQA
jgi:hypothetical protein